MIDLRLYISTITVSTTPLTLPMSHSNIGSAVELKIAI
jgi:hypothetical protein